MQKYLGTVLAIPAFSKTNMHSQHRYALISIANQDGGQKTITLLQKYCFKIQQTSTSRFETGRTGTVPEQTMTCPSFFQTGGISTFRLQTGPLTFINFRRRTFPFSVIFQCILSLFTQNNPLRCCVNLKILNHFIIAQLLQNSA